MLKKYEGPRVGRVLVHRRVLCPEAAGDANVLRWEFDGGIATTQRLVPDAAYDAGTLGCANVPNIVHSNALQPDGSLHLDFYVEFPNENN